MTVLADVRDGAPSPAFQYWPQSRNLVISIAALMIVAPIGVSVLTGLGWSLILVIVGIVLLVASVELDTIVIEEEKDLAFRRQERLNEQVASKTFVITPIRLDILRARGGSREVTSIVRRLGTSYPNAIPGPRFLAVLKRRLGPARFDDEIDLIVAVHDAAVSIPRLRSDVRERSGVDEP